MLRIWQDYALKAGDTIRAVVVVSGDAVIDGRVDGDVVVVLGNARLGATAVVEGSVVVTAGNVTIANGAEVRNDLVVVGGVVDAPPGFAPRGEHVAIGNAWLGGPPASHRAVDHARPVVGTAHRPGSGLGLGLVFFFLVISLVINALLHDPVSACAETLAVKPFSTFFVGLLTLLLAGPVSVLLAASIVGIIVVPFLWCALILAWTIGKVGVARWIGRAVVGRRSPETRLEGLQSFAIGAVAIYFLYWVPVLGLITWAMVGVFGLGAATQTFVAALRRERPRAPAPTRPPAPPAPAPPPVSPPPLPPEPAIGGAAAICEPGRCAEPPAQSVIPGPDGGIRARCRAGPDRHRDAGSPEGRRPLLPAPVRVLRGVLDVARHDDRRHRLQPASRPHERPAAAFPDALVRALSSLFSFVALGLGVLWILKDEDRQAWHDKIAGTFVVRLPRAWALL